MSAFMISWLLKVRNEFCETKNYSESSVHPVWFEMGRTELLRANGLAYKDLEQVGVFFVVAELRIKYRRPAQYDEKLHLETTCSAVTAGKVEHSYKLTRCSDGAILAEGSSILACVNAEGKIRRIPKGLPF
jgi:acyl-CoA thioester hydrolase